MINELDKNILSRLLKQLGCELILVDRTISTNDDLKKIKNINNTICEVALMQEGGRGSNGRPFVSEQASGIYFSILIENNNYKYITEKAAVCVHKVFKKIYNKNLKIKWVNDLYYDNKKVCGILCENIMQDNSIIVGIGINLFRIDEKVLSDNDLTKIAGYIFDNNEDVDKNIIIYEIIKLILESLGKNEIDEIYMNDNLILGKEVLYRGDKYIATKVNNMGHLIITNDKTSVEIVSRNDIEIMI